MLHCGGRYSFAPARAGCQEISRHRKGGTEGLGANDPNLSLALHAGRGDWPGILLLQGEPAVKLRIAKKILAAVGTARETAYTGGQLHRAWQRVERTKEQRAANEYWHYIMREIGVKGRAAVLAKHAPGMAFQLLMRTPM